jgi:hypothetical protein
MQGRIESATCNASQMGEFCCFYPEVLGGKTSQLGGGS